MGDGTQLSWGWPRSCGMSICSAVSRSSKNYCQPKEASFREIVPSTNFRLFTCVWNMWRGFDLRTLGCVGPQLSGRRVPIHKLFRVCSPKKSRKPYSRSLGRGNLWVASTGLTSLLWEWRFRTHWNLVEALLLFVPELVPIEAWILKNEVSIWTIMIH